MEKNRFFTKSLFVLMAASSLISCNDNAADTTTETQKTDTSTTAKTTMTQAEYGKIDGATITQYTIKIGK